MPDYRVQYRDSYVFAMMGRRLDYAGVFLGLLLPLGLIPRSLLRLCVWLWFRLQY